MRLRRLETPAAAFDPAEVMEPMVEVTALVLMPMLPRPAPVTKSRLGDRPTYGYDPKS